MTIMESNVEFSSGLYSSENGQKKKVMVLGASYLQSFIIRKIQEMGHEAIALDGNPDCDARGLPDKFYHCNTTDKEGVLKIAKEEEIDAILTYASDVAAPTVSYVAEELGLPCNPLDAVNIMTDKTLTRQFMIAHGFNVPKYKEVLNLEEAYAAIREIGLPVIVKPVDGSGSRGVSKIESPNNAPSLLREESLATAFNFARDNSKSKRVIIEEFIVKKGYQVDADCFMYDGKLTFFHAMDQHQDPIAPYSPIGISAPSVESKEKTEIAHQEVQRFLSLLGMRFGEYNVEYVFDNDNRLYIIEIGPRSGGNLIPDVILESSGLDLRELSIRASLGEDCSHFPYDDYTFKKNVTSFIIHSQKSGTYQGLDIDEEIERAIIFKDMFVAAGDDIHRFTGGIYALGFALMQFDKQEQMLEFIDHSAKYFRIKVTN